MNIVKNNLKQTSFLRLFLGIIFFSAGIYRLFNWQQAVLEFSKLNLNSVYLMSLTITLEIIGGIFLIFNIKTKKVLLTFIVFILLALISSFLVSGQDLINNAKELFSFDSNPTDVFLHFTYLIVLIYLFWQ
jgi:uncharacterized membrane protein YphA (DoxX/SURF4 family)